jgi:phytoene synthase
MTPTDAQAYCTTLTKKSGSNFYYSFLFLPKSRREAMYTVYAFCKEVDNAVDEPPPGSHPQDELARWRRELSAAYEGTPTLPVTISLARHVRALSIPQAYFDELINGVEMDLTSKRYATFAELSAYCYRVASVVGLICLHVFGTTSPRAQDYAVNLGMAFQLTNILRDLGNDAECGRIYLPQEDLDRFKYRQDDLMRRRYTPEFTALMQFETGRAQEFYDKARRALESLPRAERRALTVAEIMRGVYSRILHRIEESGYRVLGERVTLSPRHRLAVAAGVWLQSRLPFSNS